jgi:hypothetical protein
MAVESIIIAAPERSSPCVPLAIRFNVCLMVSRHEPENQRPGKYRATIKRL